MTRPPLLPAFYAGFGCRRGCPADHLERLLRDALAAHGLQLAQLRGIASIDLKAEEAGLQALASRLGLALTLFPSVKLHAFEPLLSHRSAAAFNHSGCWGVAESAALALAAQKKGTPRLLVPRQVGDRATVALACSR